MRQSLATATLVVLAASLAACSGGGGGGAAPPVLPPAAPTAPAVAVVPASAAPVVPASSAAPVPGASATPSAAPVSAAVVTGRVVDLPYDGTSVAPGYSVSSAGPAAPDAPIAGATVVIGPQLIGGATPPPALAAGFARTTTGADGTFAVAKPGAGRYAISIFAPPPHDTALHQDLALGAGDVAAGDYYMTVPSAGERAWLAQTNADRSIYGAPLVGIDESALEAARYWSAFMRANAYFEHCIPASLCTPGSLTPPPATYAPQDVDPQHRFRYFHGFSGASEGENIAAGFAAWQNVDAAFMAEAAACPNGQPATCTFGAATGHFLNIVDAHYVWAGFGVTPTPAGATWYDEEFSNLYDATPSATSVRRQQRTSVPLHP